MPRKKGAPEKENKRALRKKEARRNAGRKALKLSVIGVLLLIIVSILACSFTDIPLLQKPKQIISAVFAPVQDLFSNVTGGIVDYLRSLKYRANLEEEYEKLLSINEELRNENAVLSDYEEKVNQLYDLLDVTNDFASMSPLPAQVIGHDTGSYFSVLSLNVGSNDGVKEYMAVVSNGGLVGYTYNVKATTCSVRCIIDSEATVAGMLKTSRDQGSVTGTLSIDGTAMCRMYYLPETSLPRPGEQVITSGVGMEFPKGIPIGTVRESTRSLDENKSYIVLEPIVDFQHLEYVVVLLYQPSYAEDAEVRTGTQATLAPLETARPVPTFPGGVSSGFATATPEAAAGETVSPTPGPTGTPGKTAETTPAVTEDPNATPRPTNIVYVPSDPNATPTASPTPEPTPTPTPMPTFNPRNSMEAEEDE